MERYLFSEGIGRTEIEAKAFAWQSYLFNENIVGLYGYREDDTKLAFFRAALNRIEALPQVRSAGCRGTEPGWAQWGAAWSSPPFL